MKTPPNNIPAERGIISAVLQNNRVLDDVDLTAGAFYVEAHQVIWQTIQQCRNRGQVADLVTVGGKLMDVGHPVASPVYLAELADGMAISARVFDYGAMIKDCHIRREAIRAAVEITIAAHQETADDVIALAQSHFLAMDSAEDKAYSLDEVVADALAVMDNRKTGELPGLSTGLADLDARTNGLHNTDLIILAARPAMGKELTLCSDLLLCDGTFKKMGDIMQGDKLASVDGKPSKVIGVFPQGVKPVYEVTFSDGRKVKAGLDHQWEVCCRHWPTPKVLTTSQIIEKLGKKRYQRRIFLPPHEGKFGKDEGLTIHPYLLGVLLGDGGLSQTSVGLTTSHSFLVNKIEPMLMGATMKKNGIHGYRITTQRGAPNLLLEALHDMGLQGLKSHEKFIPPQYLSASRESRIELIRGIVDTDGMLEKWGTMTYTSTSHELAKGFQLLARSLGAYASMSSRITEFTYKGEKKKGRVSYTVTISCDNYGEFVTIPFKKERVKKDKASRNLNFESVEYIGDFECQCITVSHPRELYLADDYTVTHNSALAGNIAVNVAAGGVPVFFLSLEMSRSQLAERMLADKSGVGLTKIKTGGFMGEEKPRIHNAGKFLAGLPLVIDDRPSPSIAQVRSRCRRAKAQHNVGLIVVDYLQYIRAPGAKGREQEVAEISRQLKAMAKEIGVPVLSLAQLNRGSEHRESAKPKLSDLRDSGQIEQDADQVWFIYREDYYNAETERKGIADIIIAKNRNGATGTVELLWQGTITSFRNLQRHEEWAS